MVELYDHQRKAVGELRNGSILWGDVGTGKTLTALAYYVENESPRDLIVITTAKKRDSLDWERDAAKFAMGRTRQDTVHGTITVDSWNNIGKYSGREGAFFIFDEQRIVGSGAWTKSFISIAKRNHWILLSATPGDTWLDYIPVFVANGHFKNRTDFLRNHVVFNRFSRFPKVEHYTNVGKLVRLRNQLLIHMPMERHTVRKTKIITTEYDLPKLERVLSDRWNIFEERPLRDVAEMFLVLRKVVNSDTSRLEAVRQLLSVHPRLIVFYNHNYELEALRTLAQSTLPPSLSTLLSPISGPDEPTLTPAGTTSSKPSQNSSASAAELPPPSSWTSEADTSSTSTTMSGFQVAEWNGHKHEAIPETEHWVYLVQYQAGAEGWNCTSTNAMVFYSLTYSYKIWHQAYGRIDRLNTPFKTLHYYVLMSTSVIDKAIWKSLMGKKSFNETRFFSKNLDTRSQKVA